MILYHKHKIFNLLDRELVLRWFKKGLLSREQVMSIYTSRLDAYKRTNVFFRVGIFILTTISIYSAFGLWGLLLNLFGHTEALKYYLLVGAGLVFYLLYFFIRQKDHYKSGADDALLYNGLFILISSIQLFVNLANNDFVLILCITSLPLLVAAAILFSERLMAVLSFCTLLVIVFLLTLKTGTVGKMLLPFILMTLSSVAYLITNHCEKKEKYFCWKGPLQHAGYIAMAVFYLSGNYYVVREASVLLMGTEVEPGGDIPFAGFFYAFTLLVPLVYIFFGIRNRRLAMLNEGLIFVAVSALTIRYYYSLVPLELALSAGGVFLILVSLLALRYLKQPRHGITAEAEKNEQEAFNLAAESLVIAQTLSKTGTTPEQQEGTTFWGGEFGGGGAGSKY